MTKDEGYLTDAQLEAMGAAAMADLLRRHSGDRNFHWQVREAVLNRAAEILVARAVEPQAPLESTCTGCERKWHWFVGDTGAPFHLSPAGTIVNCTAPNRPAELT